MDSEFNAALLITTYDAWLYVFNAALWDLPLLFGQSPQNVPRARTLTWNQVDWWGFICM